MSNRKLIIEGKKYDIRVCKYNSLHCSISCDLLTPNKKMGSYSCDLDNSVVGFNIDNMVRSELCCENQIYSETITIKLNK